MCVCACFTSGHPELVVLGFEPGSFGLPSGYKYFLFVALLRVLRATRAHCSGIVLHVKASFKRFQPPMVMCQASGILSGNA